MRINLSDYEIQMIMGALDLAENDCRTTYLQGRTYSEIWAKLRRAQEKDDADRAKRKRRKKV